MGGQARRYAGLGGDTAVRPNLRPQARRPQFGLRNILGSAPAMQQAQIQEPIGDAGAFPGESEWTWRLLSAAKLCWIPEQLEIGPYVFPLPVCP